MADARFTRADADNISGGEMDWLTRMKVSGIGMRLQVTGYCHVSVREKWKLG